MEVIHVFCFVESAIVNYMATLCPSGLTLKIPPATHNVYIYIYMLHMSQNAQLLFACTELTYLLYNCDARYELEF
jgi:hypothetical protein